MTSTATAATPTAGVVDTPAHRDGNVLRWLAAYTASMTGDSVYYIALSWAAVQSGTPAQAGIVMSVSALPRAVLMLGGGVIADRLGPRRVVIGSDAVRCAAVLAVAALLFLTSPGLWPLALLGLVFGTVDAVFMPAVGALPARVTSRGQLARVQGMRGLGIRFASVVGGPLGGLAVAAGGAKAAFTLAGLLIAISVPLLVAVRTRELPADDTKAAGTAWHDLRAGLQYIRRHRVLAPLMLVIALGDLGFVGPLNVGLTLLADERGWGASGMGWVLGGFGTGAGVASLLLAVRGRVPHAGHVMAYACLCGAVAIGALAFVPGIVAAAGVALLIGLLAGLSGALCGALLQTQADPACLGRVTAVSSLVSLGFAPLSMPLSAAAIGAFGTGPVFVTSAAVCGLGGVVALCAPNLRRAELPA
ncbi:MULTISPECIES: MFS transporter [Streptomyces]|uniref:Integral membrane efflux protein n=1 Tax=Streptomyces sviceus (strain ATCC 29083 / DSM 924 / JCM 4929 / NBRC 13980 / NCIMB 11184 / NRRL 5439 / UC 5370) TaxID=463191 RepID=B5I4Q2_STRX2|nr:MULTISPECIES: MFS transporter [Streptomyces]EDY60057.1 integral membrane efflux protein [Streptomyces sviceus ATCC 29083]MYT05197.1 MFS transporter [Streptomyces sp. SID5470]